MDGAPSVGMEQGDPLKELITLAEEELSTISTGEESTVSAGEAGSVSAIGERQYAVHA